jgi:hypothetical protein
MGISVFPIPSAASKTRRVVTLLSGSSWTVPAGVTYVNAKLFGGGGGGGQLGVPGLGGEVVTTLVTTTPASSISYGIGAGGAGGSNAPGDGGSTTFTGAATAEGGSANINSSQTRPTDGESASNGGQSTAATNSNPGGVGGTGKIELEYWL